MKKLFDVIAVLSAICFLIFAMAVDSATMIPTYICLVCGIYLLIFIHGKGVDLDELDR